MLGSKSKLQLTDPCKPDIHNPPGKGQAVINFLKGKVFTKRHTGTYSRDDFDSDKEWEHFKAMNISWFKTSIAGVRASYPKAPSVYYASTNRVIFYRNQEMADLEKEELIPEMNSIPEEADAFYMHFEDGEVKDITVVKGSITIEDGEQIKSKTIQEGTTIINWDDGTIMSDVFISVGM
jgi:hypothetical protein